MIQRPQGELRGLTGARGVAAWLVVLFHIRLSIAGLPPVLGAIFAKGYLAVDFFFLLSGFVIWLSWGDRLHDQGRRAIGPFLRKRIARIWPLHAVMLGATVALALALRATGRSDPAAFPFADLPLHILLVQNWGFTHEMAWNIPSWSISAELGAYLIFPIVAIAIDWRRVSRRGLAAAAATLLLLLCLSFGASPSLGYDIAHFGLVRCVCEFTTGTILCALWRRGGGTSVAAVVAVLMAGLWIADVPETLVVPALFAAILYLLASGVAKPLGGRVPHYLGQVSYATYLCHYPIWIAFKLAFVRDIANVPPLVIAAYLATVLACSAILHARVERPAQRYIDGLGRAPRRLARALP